VTAAHPDLRFSFSRPGFVTFKQENADEAFPEIPAPVFVRLWGESVAQARSAEEIPQLAALIPPEAVVRAFDRDQYVPGEEPDDWTRGRGIAATGGLPTATEREPRPGEAVYDLIWIDERHVFLGRHVHTDRLSPAAGNIPPLAVPEHSPSRAWLKIEEAILRFRPVMQPGWTALEIGCAPGGASTALIDRGFSVTGIDPQFMADSVMASGKFNHIRKPARFVTPEDLANVNPDWIVMDMSIPPEDALGELSHVVKTLRDVHGKKLATRRGFLTIKLNDWKYAERVSDYLSRLRKIGFEEAQATQLAYNRREFFVYSPKFKI